MFYMFYIVKHFGQVKYPLFGNAQPEIPLNNAIQEFLDKKLVTVEYLLCDQVHLTEEGVVDWLLDTDVHLIITHVHQNIVDPLFDNLVNCSLTNFSSGNKLKSTRLGAKAYTKNVIFTAKIENICILISLLM